MYITWDEETNLRCAKLKWYNVEDVQELITTLFNLVHEDKILDIPPGRELIKMLKEHTPATQHDRFPENQVLICHGIGYWGDHIDRLIYAANWLGGFENKHVELHKYVLTISTATNLILELIEEIRELISWKLHTFSRETFESHFSLEWVDD